MAVALVGTCFALCPADPSRADPSRAVERQAQLTRAAAAADDALAHLAETLSAALAEARDGAALTVAGDRPPAPNLLAAAAHLQADAALADAARRALDALAGTAAAVPPLAPIPELPYSGPELLEIAEQLRSAADGATVFVERRNAAGAVTAALGEAVAALDDDRPTDALEHVAAASAPLETLRDWNERPPLLTYWMTVIGRMLDAAEGIAVGTIEHDPAAVEAAAAAYAEASELARGADNSLALVLSEEGAAITGPPLRRLAAAIRELEQVVGNLAPLLPDAAS